MVNVQGHNQIRKMINQSLFEIGCARMKINIENDNCTMKGHRKQEQERRASLKREAPIKASKGVGVTIKFTPLDLFPLDPTPENVMKYIAESYWVEAQCIHNMGLEHPLIDDTIQYIYEQIFRKMDRLLEIYETRGILAFCGYIKQITQIHSKFPTATSKEAFGKVPTVGMSKEMEMAIDEQYNPDVDEIYHLK